MAWNDINPTNYYWTVIAIVYGYGLYIAVEQRLIEGPSWFSRTWFAVYAIAITIHLLIGAWLWMPELWERAL